MASTASKTSEETMSKAEVSAYLGKSKRTVEIFIAKGRLGVGYFAGRNGKTAIFKRSEVEALKRDIDTPMYRAIPDAATERQGFGYFGPTPPETPGPPAVTPPTFDATRVLDELAVRLTKMLAPPATLGTWFTLDEAAIRSGLPKSYLLAQAKAGASFALNVSASEARANWRFRVEAPGVAGK